jgi:hypothetical protein
MMRTDTPNATIGRGTGQARLPTAQEDRPMESAVASPVHADDQDVLRDRWHPIDRLSGIRDARSRSRLLASGSCCTEPANWQWPSGTSASTVVLRGRSAGSTATPVHLRAGLAGLAGLAGRDRPMVLHRPRLDSRQTRSRVGSVRSGGGTPGSADRRVAAAGAPATRPERRAPYRRRRPECRRLLRRLGVSWTL